MKICPDCKAENADTAKFCLVCGHLLTEADITEEIPGFAETAETDTPSEESFNTQTDTEKERFEDAPESDEPQSEAPQTDAPEADAAEFETEGAPTDSRKPEEPVKDAKEKGLLKTWQYFLLEALFAVPFIGTVCLFIFSLSRPKNESLRRFSASRLIWRLILYILVFALVAAFLIRLDYWVPRFAAFFDLLSDKAVH